MAATVALLLVPLIWRTIAWFVLKMPFEYNYVATEARIDSIAWGALLAVLLRRRLTDGKALQTAPFIHPVWFLAGILALIATLLIRDEDFRWTLRFTIQGIALFLIFANLLFDPRWAFMVKILEWPPIRYLGRISYGLYLYHMLVYRLVAMLIPEANLLIFIPVALLASVAVAALSYRLIDDPVKAIRRRFGSHVGYRGSAA
jgi:peptidoglycan/LPS O-acetylase OafA/YrhL